MAQSKQHKLTVTAKCISCKHKREIKPGEIPKGELPVCPKCYSPMVAEHADVR